MSDTRPVASRLIVEDSRRFGDGRSAVIILLGKIADGSVHPRIADPGAAA